MLTEGQANKKWCPLVRALHVGDDDGVSGINRAVDGYPVPSARCIGSDCMAWRWSRAKETEAYLAAVQERMKKTSENFAVASNKVWAEIGSTFEQVEGYCGAFGKP